MLKMYEISVELFEIFYERCVRTNDCAVRNFSYREVAPVVFYHIIRLWTDTQCDLLYVKHITFGE